MVQENSLKNKVIVIAGATSCGKTDLSIKIAKDFNCEIINADASQFKKGLDIGTAKIREEEKENIVHYLIDIINPLDDFSISDFQKLGRLKIEEVIKKGKTPIICGGSGLYIDSLISSYNLLGKKSDHKKVEDEFSTYSNIELYHYLESLDKSLALNTHPNNRTRVLRYIERARSGDSFTVNSKEYIYDCMYLYVSRDRKLLYDRINKRTDKMMENGWIDECLSLKNRGIDLSKIKEIGYKEIGDYLNKEISYDEMLDLIKKETRHYAKRQITWFKNKTKHILVDLDNLAYDDLKEKISYFIKGESDEE